MMMMLQCCNVAMCQECKNERSVGRAVTYVRVHDGLAGVRSHRARADGGHGSAGGGFKGVYIIPVHVRVRAARYRPQHKTRSIMSGRGGGGRDGGGGGGGGGRGGRGGGRGGRGGRGGAKKESILELARLQDATVRVKCIGGRELQGTLRGYDELVNLVLDECEEFLRGELYIYIYTLMCLY